MVNIYTKYAPKLSLNHPDKNILHHNLELKDNENSGIIEKPSNKESIY